MTGMLSRTADNLYWLGRYVERAENAARLIDGTYHLNLLPITPDEHGELWRRLFQSNEELELFLGKHPEFDGDSVVEHMVLDPENPSSIVSCIDAARDNTRAARAELTTEISQCMDQTWMDIRAINMDKIH